MATRPGHRATGRKVLLALLTCLPACGGDKGGPSDPVVTLPGPPAQLVITAGNGQSAFVGTVLPDSLGVRVSDAAGKPVPGATVTWTVQAGGGTLTASSTATRADGTASTQWTLGLAEGAQSVTASVGSLAPASFTATATVNVTGSASVGANGAVIGLADGTRVVFPAGAVPATAQVTLAKGDPTTILDGTTQAERVLLALTSSVPQFAAPVEIRVPLPAAMTAADTASLLVGRADSTGTIDVQRSTIRLIDGKPYAVVQTTSFSNWIYEWFAGKTPPPAAGPLRVPYYNQGQSAYCWAASVNMVTQAASFADGRPVTEVIGRMGVDETGIGESTFRTSSVLADVVKTRTGVKPDRKRWDFGNIGELRYYLRQEIGINGRPVAVYSDEWEHAVVVVGYDEAGFILHDPKSTTNDAIGYLHRPWSHFTAGVGTFDRLVSFTVPRAVPATGAEVTVNLGSGSMQLVKPKTSDADPSAIWHHKWDYRVPAGYSFLLGNAGAPVPVLPGAVTGLNVNGDVEITNISRMEPRSVSVWLDITAVGAPGGLGHFSLQRTLTVPPNGLRYFRPGLIPVDTFRYNTPTDGEYLLSVTALVEGTTVDRQSIRFRIESVTPKLDSIRPDSGLAGDQVRLRGTGFGTTGFNNRVTFAGMIANQVNAWSDTLIVVRVPTGAITGPVVVKRGEVSSNARTFTVIQKTTLTGSITRSYGDEVVDGLGITVSGSWSVSGVGVRLRYEDPATGNASYEARIGAAVDIGFNFTATLSDPENFYLNWDPWLNNTGSPSYGGSGSGGSSSYVVTINNLTQSFCVNPYFAVYRVADGTFDNGRTVASICLRGY